jgi:hypothetical protein
VDWRRHLETGQLPAMDQDQESRCASGAADRGRELLTARISAMKRLPMLSLKASSRRAALIPV